MDKFGKSQPVRRLEDQRFLTGRVRYVDDIAPDNALHAAFVRSQVAHGNLSPVDLTEARAMPGVHLALAAEDLEARGIDFIMHDTAPDNVAFDWSLGDQAAVKAVFANAATDAVSSGGGGDVQMQFTAEGVWRALRASARAAE
ncbi:MAG: hypothetical protein HKM96_02590 [Boseongicola sp.]|nr:hypothetical protein [Boseongicola sp.]